MNSDNMSRDTILTNAILVLRDQALVGTIVLHGTRIAEIQPGRSHAPEAIDLGGDYLIPGVVDLHTDNLERQVQPRSLARWPSRSAMVAHDAQCAAAGITTVLDALCLGDLGFDQERLRTFQDGVVDLDALTEAGLLKSDHYLHLRCEIPALDMLDLLDPVADHRLVRMISLMDHSPGVGQYADVDFYRELRRRGGLDQEAVERGIEKLREQRLRVRGPNRRALLDRVSGTTIALASHDDRTVEEIAENAADGIRISEFPVTMAAAMAAKQAGMRVIAGAPNIVRGGSHNGNVAAADLVGAGAVDALASDYVPSSLIEAAFQIARGEPISLPDAVAMVSDHPARMSGLTDRGRLETGLRADLVRVRLHETLPIVRQVWSAGERVI
jgi:alpha-D-ribose 1-methylphosphonate 5-triphosphate diphosphatase